MDGATFAVREGSITALIGPNGAGKTTAFNLVTGFVKAEGGTVTFEGRDISGQSPTRSPARAWSARSSSPGSWRR